jgi:hypothetical protein
MMFRIFKYIASQIMLVVMFSSCAGTLKDNSLPQDLPRDDVRLFLLDQDRWAMSAHNMQPWEVVLDKVNPLFFRVYLANDRILPATDPYSRQIAMSMGGFLSVLEDAAAAQGYSTQIDLFPKGVLPVDDIGVSFALPIAEVKLKASTGITESGYLDAISSATVKANLKTAAFSQTDELSYLKMDVFDGVELRLLQDEDSVAELKVILKAGFSSGNGTRAHSSGILRADAS